ncbi:hypothetical protein DV737_g2911, partial [Chaetothyriales sp. CBS 132003]
MASTPRAQHHDKVEGGDVELDESAYSGHATDYVESALLSHYDNIAGQDIDAYSEIKGRTANRGLGSSLAAIFCNSFPLHLPLISSGRLRQHSAKAPADSAASPRGFWASVRWAFNYPEPGLKLRKTAWLDALRGLAAFNVFLFHWAEVWVDKDAGWGTGGQWNNPDAWWAAPFIRLIFDGGSASVSLFFSISGYVLTSRMLSLIRQQKTDELFVALSSAVMRRGIRLYMPVVILTFFLMNWAWVTGWPLARVLDYEDSYLWELWRWYIQLTRLWMPLRYPDRAYRILNIYDGTVSWTIPLEYYGSITVWVALLFTARITSFGVRAAIFAVLIFMYTVTDEWYVVQFFVGAIYAEYHLVRDEQRQKKAEIGALSPPSQQRTTASKAAIISILIVGLYLSSMPGYWTDPNTDELDPRPFYNWLVPPRGWYRWSQPDRFIWDIGSDCVLIAIGELETLQRLLEKRPFQYLGRISFGLYLCHMTVRGLLKPLDNTYLRLWGLEDGVLEQVASLRYAGAYWTRILVGAPILFIIAGLFERWVDRPSINMGRRFEKFALRIGGRGIRS